MEPVVCPHGGAVGRSWCPSNAGEQTLLCNMLNQRSFVAACSRQSITWIALPRRVVRGDWPEVLDPLADTYADQSFQGPLG
jgi:hypothetical protein